MAPLPGELRGSIEKTIIRARDAAEAAAESALAVLQVQTERLPASYHEALRPLRNALRARARQLGQGQLKEGWKPLVEEVAYEQWHRMLFARFLAENNLLMHPEGAPVTLDECAELAEAEGEPDAWALAARYASQMLPGIFRLDDPSAQVRLTPEGRQGLEDHLLQFPSALFTADDGLGWVYQFWQAKKKDEVNAAGHLIGGTDLFPVTQLFTEDYMVRFLLENSLGAWWAARHPHSPLGKKFAYLRIRDDGTPAAGDFTGWPEHVSQVTVMDPCCGSGHFLVAAFDMLRQMRMEEEGLSPSEAADAVLRDNLYGLEIDPRCTQIAAFAVALAAWKSSGYHQLPVPNVVCSGIPVEGQFETWTSLAANEVNLQGALERLYQLFRNAPELGSLINPADVPIRDRMFMPDYATVQPLLQRALASERHSVDPTADVFGAAAAGLFRAATLLSREYTLVATNVPYLTSSRQSAILKRHCVEHFRLGKADLATAFIERCLTFCATGGSIAVVTPQSWRFLGSYRNLRERILKTQSINCVAWLGSGAFETISGAVVNTALFVISTVLPAQHHTFCGLDASSAATAKSKDQYLITQRFSVVKQESQLTNPEYRISLETRGTSKLLIEYADSYEGIGAGDLERFSKYFWEIAQLQPDWQPLRSTTRILGSFSGLQKVLYWQNGKGELYDLAQQLRERLKNTWQRGSQAWRKKGVAINRMGDFLAELYFGEIFDSNIAAVIPKDEAHLPAIWYFVKSAEFRREVRKLDNSLKITNVTFLKVPFDLARWQRVAEGEGPLPESRSDDPTQWVYHGDPSTSQEPLQTAVARLLGYRWPMQKADHLGMLTDGDGIACLPSVAGQQPLHEQLRTFLARFFGGDWSQQLQDRLLAITGHAGKPLEVWLRDAFFAEHCALFHNRPFIWHIWDGRKDGFSAVVNYHKFDAALLNKLVYTYLGTWINDRRADVEVGIAGAEGRLVAALELKKKLEIIRDGEPPYDIFVRWKPLKMQPIGWNPDLNDGVRLNIRPFVLAGVLRTSFNISWNKDRGKNPDGSDRLNDLHYTVSEKLAARNKAGVKAR
jgi:hypothetical protein